MTESALKVVLDRDGLTISGDTFSLTTNGSDPRSIDSVVSELQSVTRGTYGQYCGLARAIEAVGERWGLLIIRDLLVGPRSVAQLHQGLPRVPMSLLAKRIKEMAYSGIVERSESSDDEGGAQYRLTAYGRVLEEVVLAMGRWGSAMLLQPRPEDIITEDSMMVALRATFLDEASHGRSLRFTLDCGDVVVHGIVEDGRLEVGRGALAGAPVIAPGPSLKGLLTGTTSVVEAMTSGQATGDAATLETFVTMFALPDLPAPTPSPV